MPKESENPITSKDELAESEIVVKKVENQIGEESAELKEQQQHSGDEKVPKTDKISVPENNETSELNNSKTPITAPTETAVVSTGSESTKSTPTETNVEKIENESAKSKESVATSSWMARFDSWRMFERIGPAKDQQRTGNQNVPNQTAIPHKKI